MIRYWPGLVSYSYRPLPYYLALLLGLRELRVVMTLLSKLIGLSCMIYIMSCLPN